MTPTLAGSKRQTPHTLQGVGGVLWIVPITIKTRIIPMKKLIVPCLIAVAAISLSACASEPTHSTTTTSSQTTVPAPVTTTTTDTQSNK